jgi:hypothetical protein
MPAVPVVADKSKLDHCRNAGGERISGENNDCTVKAFSAAWNVTYKEAHAVLAKNGRKQRRGFVSAKLFREGNLAEFGDWHKTAWTRVRVKTFLRQCDPSKRYMCRIRGHAFAVVDSRVRDWNDWANYILKTAWECNPRLDRPGAINLPALVRK